MRSPIFLILFTIFSLLSFGVTAIAQTEQPLTPAQAALEKAKAEKLDAEQKKNEAEAALTEATEALNIAEQKVADAEIAAKNEEGEIEKARQAVKDAEDELATAESELESARSALADAQAAVSSAETKKDDATNTVNAARAKLDQLLGGTGGGGSDNGTPPADGAGNVVFATITPKLLEHDCKEPPERVISGVLRDPEVMVDGASATQFSCKGLFTAKFALDEKMVIDAVNIQSEVDSPSFTGNTAKVYVDDKEVAEQDIPTSCQYNTIGDCKYLPTRVDFENVEGQFITIEFTKALPNEKNAIESEIAEVSVVAGKI